MATNQENKRKASQSKPPSKHSSTTAAPADSTSARSKNTNSWVLACRTSLLMAELEIYLNSPMSKLSLSVHRGKAQLSLFRRLSNAPEAWESSSFKMNGSKKIRSKASARRK